MMYNDPLAEHTNNNITQRNVLSVAELNRRAKDLLEMHLPLLWVEGEVSNLSKPSSGHWYFSLKDERAQVRCAMFKGRNQTLRFNLNAGDKVIVRARVSLYEGRGDFQLIVEHLEEAGFGTLQRQYDALKAKLLAEGLFEPSTKLPLPALPRHIGVITSPTGAAIRDVLAVLARRFAAIPVTVFPTSVQGDKAPAELINALALAHKFAKCDVLILCRGGGSIEDLWAFNDEQLARAIHEATIPIVAAVGHEIDFTIADFVADFRAPTPSAAAEALSPNRVEIEATIANFTSALVAHMRRTLLQKRQLLTHLQARITHPRERLQNRYQRLDQLEIRLRNTAKSLFDRQRNRLNDNCRKLFDVNPQYLIADLSKQINQLENQSQCAVKLQLASCLNRLQKIGALLDAVSPLATLKRGYAIAQDEQGKIVKSAGETQAGAQLRIRLGQGQLISKVISIDND